MKRVVIVGKNRENVKALKQHLLIHGFVYDNKKPELVISLGGDGTYLYAERQYPSVPKLLIRDSNICNKCGEDVLDKVIDKLKAGKYHVLECMKLDAQVNGKRVLTCANDFVLRNKRLTQAIRFALDIGTKQIDGELIGDGLVISTSYGSTAYYYSITKQHFNYGIGIAFNNLTKRMRPLVVDENAILRITMVRESAELAADNNPKLVRVNQGDVIEIRKRKETAKILKVNIGFWEWLKHVQFLGRRRSI
ncbi:NAD(+)/NADH kinase [Candidatus Woesearchaeota archaeon]|nr:NAD(+)/NADH kinase [Candidatus Woesearchaeota archaeon]